MEKKADEFETALARLDAIVAELEAGNLPLDRSVDLFKEGKDLARRCDALLKDAQSKIDAAGNGAATAENH
jgi:exodeoxyribonuclease VII small subunit